MSETHLDLSRIPHIEERRKCLELSKQIDAIEDERSAAIGKIEDEYQEERMRLYAKVEAELKPMEEGIEKAKQPFDERINALQEQINALGVDFEWGENYPMPELCAITGLPFLDGELKFESNETYDQIIGALVVTPKPEPEESDEVEDAA
jgi:DNA-binding FrmR family transcriptional regulator